MADANEKTQGQLLSEKLSFKIKNVWETAGEKEIAQACGFAEEYKRFLDLGKTEREFTGLCLQALREEGFAPIEEALDRGGVLKPGDRVYRNLRDKALLCAIIGERPLRDGLAIAGAHVDSPRIDLKTNPLYEDSGFALFDTHYYGGIKHYQWTAIPLAMHGVVVGRDGQKKNLCVGEDAGDPVFTISDLLPHLAQEQMEKKASDFLGGEELDILAGSRPYRDEKAEEKVKLTVLQILNETCGMTEEDFASAEIEFVPAFKARDVGLDRSMIGAYGHDDRSCAYAAFFAALRCAPPGSAPEKTIVCFLSDKEEVGSMGNTGAESRALENFLAYLGRLAGGTGFSPEDLRRALEKSSMLSADVNAAYDPNFAQVYDKKTASWFGKGMALSKYTGRRGKLGGSEANAEFCRRVQAILDRNGVRWQYGNLGKVDKGGGGTIALYAANLGMDVLDCGIPVLSMHSPFEVISKIDLYTTYRGYLAFLKEA
ncbi:MAG: aminopeptidase [Spirochaetia bacterium]|jgi:aspartyl aminopeptidase|nr:aminopeptidase [Spirochaetia bacterium]